MLGSVSDFLSRSPRYVVSLTNHYAVNLYNHDLANSYAGPGTHYQTLPTLWRPLDSRLVRLETGISQHRRWLQKETETPVQQYTDISLHRKDYLDFLHRQSDSKANGHADQEDQRVAKRLRRVAKVQSWLSSSGISNTCDKGQQQYHHTDSTAWFLHTGAYLKWRNMPFDIIEANDSDALVRNWQHRVLFVQGKSAVVHSSTTPTY